MALGCSPKSYSQRQVLELFFLNVYEAILFFILGVWWIGLLRVSEYLDIHESDKKFEYQYSLLQKSLDRDFLSKSRTRRFKVNVGDWNVVLN